MDQRKSTHGPLADRALEVRHEQRRRWISGQPVSLDELLSRDADLQREEAVVLNLLYADVYLRRRAGESPTSEDYQAQFPWLGSKIRLVFDAFELERDRASATTVHVLGSSATTASEARPTKLEEVLLQFSGGWRHGGAPPEIDACEI
jgi:hypothetical protein